jgi:hypothetical protein
VVLRLVVENHGEEPFPVSTGGDTRGTSRPVRFTVSAIREDGLVAGDPAPDQDCGGGGSHRETVPPGGKWSISVWLSTFRMIRDSGNWTVTVHHDLGWTGAPEASLRLRSRPPLPFETRFLVAAALSTDGEYWYMENQLGWQLHEHRGPPAPTLEGIFHPAYLPALADAARRGEVRAIRPISRIADPGATRVLADLLRIRRRGGAAEAAEALCRRIPDPEHPEWPAGSYGLVNSPPSDLDRSQVASWIPDIAPRIRAAARRLVGQGEPALRAAGARLLSHLAEPEDYETVAKALATVNREGRDAGPRMEDWWRDPEARLRREALHYLRTAIERIGRRGVPVPAAPRTEAEGYLYLAALPAEPDRRPEGWEGVVAGLLGHGSADVRSAAMAMVPSPVGAVLRSAFEGALLDRDPEVAAHACWKARDIGDAFLLDAVLSSARKALTKHHLKSALDAATALGDRLPGLLILVDRLDDPDLGFAAVCMLVERFSPGMGGHSLNGTTYENMKGIQLRWRAFLAIHGRDVAAGKVFRAGDGFITKDLFPPGTRYSLGGNRMGWPGE